MTKIYTRTGDKGTTSLFTGQRVDKNDLFIEALGTVDEGNSTLGLALSFLPKEERLINIKGQLEIIQHALFDLGAALATPLSSGSDLKIQKTRFDQEAIHDLEKWIDKMEETLPPLKTFILPGGHPAGAALHVARSIIRRAERVTLPLLKKGEIENQVVIYLNRLSDYLFVLSRHLNHLLNIPETPWQPHPLKH